MDKSKNMLTWEEATRMAFQRESRVDRTPIGVRMACVEQAAVLLESWWRAKNDGQLAASYRWLAGQTLSHVILWKFSEAFSTDKRLGAPFWSEGAIASLQRHGQATTPSWFKSQNMPTDDALVHEHVCERGDLVERLLDRGVEGLRQGDDCDREQLGTTLSKLCVGCVVTRAEHKRLTKKAVGDSDMENPWLRYGRAKPAVRVVMHGRVAAAVGGPRLSDDGIVRLHRDLIIESRAFADAESA